MHDSQELKDKLRIIEAETDFFSRAPELPSFSRLYIIIMSICALVLFRDAIENGDLLVFFVIFAAASINVLIFLQSKKLFELYSDACEIINYYKKSDEKRI